ncbi:hypothetical protein [Nocardia rhizosphaerihabitans]|uniref:HTH cro/C1-type domain-containing protein n=1 Tax=Nocardia rhizosphaerihabitans TaxID=1691570 RepID=A0ABQ2K3X7_9NOCA|nr:hypothetical protein [Nocardia rhizosphaerihabitans]GGN65782.1 hypothetical protein GCM10011610_00040 [Nocardia rhizosphaerihabitans]
MIRGQGWTGFEAAALQEAMRLSIREYAAMLGIESTTINNWRSGLSAVKPRSKAQGILDTTYAKRATPEDRERFEQIVAEGETAWRARHSKDVRKHNAVSNTDNVPTDSEPDRGSTRVDAPLVEADDFSALVTDIETAFWTAGNVTDTGALRPLSALLAASRAVTRLNMAGEYTTLALLVGPLITDLYRHAHDSRAEDQRIAWDTLTQVAFDTSVVMRARGHLALAWSAARTAEEAARSIDSQPGAAAAAFVSSQVLLARPASAKAALDRAERTAAIVGARAQTANELQTVGMLHLQASLATAATGGDPRDHLEYAAAYAARLDRPISADNSSVISNTTFGSSNVALWKMSVAMEAGEPEAVLDLAKKLKPQTLPTPGRAAQYWVEVGRAAASRRAHEIALDAFLRAESIAPEHVRTMDTVQESVAQMMREAKRSLTAGDLGNLAQRVGVAVV